MPAHALLIGAIFLALCFGAAALGAAFTARSVREWYPTLRKPAGTPPNSYFGPVWTALYILMAVAAWNVYLKSGGLHQAALPLTLFFIQLLLNIGWSAIFFGKRSLSLAFVEIVVLWLFIFGTMLAFWKVSSLSGWLMLPYLLWVSYAARLNIGIMRLNPDV